MVLASKSMARSAKDFSYNYIEQENRQELLAEIKKRELGTIIMKPLAGGALRQTGAATSEALRSTERTHTLEHPRSNHELRTA